MELLDFEAVYKPMKFERLLSAGNLHDIESIYRYIDEGVAPSKAYWVDKRVLVTGLDGMVGSTIADQLISLGAHVSGTVKRHAVHHRPNIQHNLDSGSLKAYEADLCDYGRTQDIIRQVEPHAIFHQAAESFVPSSLEQPGSVVNNNCVSTVNVLEAATKYDKSLEGIQLACSSEEYGFVKSLDELPISEDRELRPTSTYAVTKVFTEYIGKSYWYMYRTPTLMTRCFNQEGPRRGPQFFTARIARQVSDCISGKADKIVMGNPNAVRDFTHVHDSAAAQILAIEKGVRGDVYNVCSGIGMTTGYYAKLALMVYGLDVPVYIDKSLLRSYERGDNLFDGFIGSNKKFIDQTGWHPKKTVVDIIRDGVASQWI